MTRQEAIQEACSIIALAYRSIRNYEYPSDGFCSKCEAFQHAEWNYQNKGLTLDYVRKAVVNQLTADGYPIHSAFNPETGKEIDV